MTSPIKAGVYKIVSSTDSNCLDAEGGGGKKKTKIISWNYEGSNNQKFQIHKEGTGYRVANLVRAKDNILLVIELGDKDKVPLLQDFTGDDVQQWMFVPVRNSEGSYLIKNVKSGLCLRTMGHGAAVSPQAEAADDKRLVFLYPLQNLLKPNIFSTET